MIIVGHLSLAFPTPTVLHSVLSDLSFTIADNEFVAMMGANGSGKTSLARCLNGISSPTAGEVLVDGLSTRNPHNLIEIRRRVGMVFQNPDNQMVAPTVEREIAFGLENLGVPRDEMHARVDEMLECFKLTALRRRAPHELSGGEKQRVALAGVMVMQPRYLILDEPTSLLDYPSRVRLFETLAHLRQARAEAREHLSVLLITQFAEETLFAERLLVLHRGALVMDGLPQEILQRGEEMAQIGLLPPLEFRVHQALLKKGKSIPLDELMLSPVL